MSIEQQIEELRAELAACVEASEREQIATELELARAALTAQEQRA